MGIIDFGSLQLEREFSPIRRYNFYILRDNTAEICALFNYYGRKGILRLTEAYRLNTCASPSGWQWLTLS